MSSAGTKPVKKRRRWLRYSLRTLLIFITFVAIGTGWVTNERRQSAHELEIAEQLKARGATIVFAGLFDPVCTDPSFQPAKDEAWWRVALRNLFGPRVRIVWYENYFSLDDLATVAQFKTLDRLYVNGAQVRDLAPLAGLKHLKALTMANTPVNDLSPLAGLENLQQLQLREVAVSDLSPIAGLKNLQELLIQEIQVSDVSPIAELKNLQRLQLDWTQVGDLSPMAELTNLQLL